MPERGRQSCSFDLEKKDIFLRGGGGGGFAMPVVVRWRTNLSRAVP